MYIFDIDYYNIDNNVCNINDITPRIYQKSDDMLDFHLNWVFVLMTIFYTLLIYKIKFIS